MTDVATHAEGCWAWGPQHHACAVREIERLRARVADAEAVRHSLNEMVRVLDGSVNEVDADFDVEVVERVLGTAAWNDQLTVVKADTVRCWMAKIEGLRRTIKAQVGELRAARDAQSKAEEDVESLRARVAELERDLGACRVDHAEAYEQGRRDALRGVQGACLFEMGKLEPLPIEDDGPHWWDWEGFPEEMRMHDAFDRVAKAAEEAAR